MRLTTILEVAMLIAASEAQNFEDYMEPKSIWRHLYRPEQPAEDTGLHITEHERQRQQQYLLDEPTKPHSQTEEHRSRFNEQFNSTDQTRKYTQSSRQLEYPPRYVTYAGPFEERDIKDFDEMRQG